MHLFYVYVLILGFSLAWGILDMEQIDPAIAEERSIIPGKPASPIPTSGSTTSQDIWVTSEGSVPFGEETTLGEAKVKSLEYARRSALQQAVGTLVQRKSVVYNFQLAEDLVQTTVRGVIVREEILREGPQEIRITGKPMALMYVTKIRASVRPVRLERKNTIALKASLNKTTFTAGEEMDVHVVPDQEVFLHIFSVGQDDTVSVLLPNRFTKDNRVAAKADFVFPSESQKSNGLHLRVFPSKTAKPGYDRVKIIATTKDIDLTKGKFKEGIFLQYPGKDSALITDLLKELALVEESQWGEITIAYEVQAVN